MLFIVDVSCSQISIRHILWVNRPGKLSWKSCPANVCNLTNNSTWRFYMEPRGSVKDLQVLYYMQKLYRVVKGSAQFQYTYTCLRYRICNTDVIICTMWIMKSGS